MTAFLMEMQGDQASIIGGVVEYIKELQQVLRSLEAKKHRKAYAEQVLSPRPATVTASPRPLIKSTPPLSPRVAVPISPRTPTPGSPYKPCGRAGGRLLHQIAAAAAYMTSPAMTPTSSSSSYPHDQQHYSSQPYLPTLDSIVTELAAHAARPAAVGLLLPDVKVEFAGPNLVLKTVSRRTPGQALKIIAALESPSLEILHASVSTVDDTMMHSFTIKVGGAAKAEDERREVVDEAETEGARRRPRVDVVACVGHDRSIAGAGAMCVDTRTTEWARTTMTVSMVEAAAMETATLVEMAAMVTATVGMVMATTILA
ncbi:transcription factor SPEECHLESS-like [Phragmites australis]|uniref:transcription factor SPEECHLESS-like n=1 Tax=Phragmites australis TaxID=29695 RepID=UPI002D774CAD|nr:transcription factor SPEECHLESS-like [Phragmites australis]